ncbi:hypothetical protein [Streptomyces sp. 35G-GA-8]|uniref:hypothetical protein n=1 Tax=Streptomyces sp. 35G-GA-8 TaxID=2939434 RepID=UPI00201F98FF|nr:hypothetical protein [Streptomyces sp. 35G-GA-8]MCL7382128.1 hypothetical protein [Streptomyces sp. 35G-GA-8]
MQEYPHYLVRAEHTDDPEQVAFVEMRISRPYSLPSTEDIVNAMKAYFEAQPNVGAVVAWKYEITESDA